MERPDFEVSEADYTRYVEGENAEAAKPIQAEIVGEVQVRDFPARSWAAWQNVIDNTGPQQIAGGSPQRTTLRITNTNLDRTVWIAPTKEGCTIGSAFPILGLESETFEHTGPVYAISDEPPATAVTLGLAAEYRDGGT